MLTGQKQHTGNWTGKTVGIAKGICAYQNKKYTVLDLPGTYSLTSFTPEENITCENIKRHNYNVALIVVNATKLESNLPLVLQILTHTQKAVLCLNMMDEAYKKNIRIDIDELSLQLGIPVIPITASKKKFKSIILDTVNKVIANDIKTFNLKKLKDIELSDLSYTEKQKQYIDISKSIVKYSVKSPKEYYKSKDILLDKIFTSRKTGIPIMILVFFLIFWLTAYGSNYPGEILSYLFDKIIAFSKYTLENINAPDVLTHLITDGILTTTAWVVSVMLPPALIFFPLFSILEECGYLPRIAFNLDKIFFKTGTNGKLAITMLMGFGCNTCGVMGCRIIKNKRERFIATVTNSFIPCNGRFPTLITLCSIFFATTHKGIVKSLIVTGILLSLLLLSVLLSLIVSLITTKLSNNNESSDFILDLPSYRKPKIIKVILDSIRNKVLFTLSRAVMVAIPAGAIIWLLVNVNISDQSVIKYITDFLNPLGVTLGMDGVILTSFILAFPANEILIPTALMIYLNNSSLIDIGNIISIGEILKANNWTIITALCACVFCLFHFPCSTTCLTIKKETQNIRWTLLSVLIPLVAGTIICYIISLISSML